MSNVSPRLRLATLALLAAAASAAASAPASAQLAKYCEGGELVANALYANPDSNGKTAEVTYYGQFQNMNPTKTLKVELLRLDNINIFKVNKILVAGPLTFAPYQQLTVTLLTVMTQNAAGTGGPSPAEVASQIKFFCSPS